MSRTAFPTGTVGYTNRTTYEESCRSCGRGGTPVDFQARAVVLSDTGDDSGAGDDIKIAAQRHPGINDWDVYWISWDEFTQDDTAVEEHVNHE